MHHDGNHSGQGTYELSHGDSQREQQRGIEYGVSLRAAAPAPVLASAMDNGALAELARLNTAMAPLAMRVMDGSASAIEQHNYARHLIAAGKRLQRRANERAAVSVTKPALKQPQPDNSTGGDATCTNTHTGIPRRVSVIGKDGISATVVVTTYRGQVWLSVVPSFNGEAIMESREVNELIRTLELAQEDADMMGPAPRHGRRGSNAAIQEITSGTEPPGNKVVRADSSSLSAGPRRSAQRPPQHPTTS